MDWRDKRVLITGASSGIGWAIAELLARRGARIGAIARRADKLDELAASLGPSCRTATADVDDPGQVRSACGRLEGELGPWDVLIANAGVLRHTPGFRFKGEDFRRVLTTNVLGVVNTLDAVLPDMVRRRKGHVVGIASIAALLGLPCSAAYSASKAALVTLFQSLRVDLASYGVRVTTICPGFVRTPLIDTSEERPLIGLLSAEEAARKIVRAIERNRGEYWFPKRTWLLARIARALPFPLYKRLVPGPENGRGSRGALRTSEAPRS